MTGIRQRLFSAGILTMILHIVLLSRQLDQGPVTQPTPRPVQRIAISLGVGHTAKEILAKPGPFQNLQKRKTVATQPEPKLKTAQSLPEAKPTVLPDKNGGRVFRKRLVKSHPEPDPLLPEEPRLVQSRARVQERSGENQPVLSHSAPHSETIATSGPSGTRPSTAEVVQQASPLYQINPSPEYPDHARRRGLEGIVLLEALIDTSGRVAELKLFTSSGHSILDRAALKALRRWHFSPGSLGGNRQEMWVKVPVRFQLQ